MKNQPKAFSVIFAVFVLILQFVMLFPVYLAAGDSNETISGFSTSELPDSNQKKIEENINLKPISQMNANYKVDCFDVSDSGQIAVGVSSGGNKYVYVFDSDGQFDRGYSFTCDGMFLLGWNSDNVLIYLVRGNYEISINDQGLVSEVRKIEGTTENDAYWRKIMNAKTKTVGEKEYLLKNNKMIVKTKDSETIIYDASKVFFLRNVFIAVIVVLVLVVVLFAVKKRFSPKPTE